jgi:hypothetical protein
MNVPATTREDTLQSMNTRRRFKRRGSKSSSMMMMDLRGVSRMFWRFHTFYRVHLSTGRPPNRLGQYARNQRELFPPRHIWYRQ